MAILSHHRGLDEVRKKNNIPGKHFKKSQKKHKEFGNAVGFLFQARANKILRSDVSMNVQRIINKSPRAGWENQGCYAA